MAKKKKKNGRLFVIITVLATIVIVPIAFMTLSAKGEKAGVEFSPDDFTMRSFNYCRLPLVNWTLRGIERKDVINLSATTLIDDDWVRATGRTPKRWHLVSENGVDFSSYQKASAECDARFLTKYFDFANSDGENIIINWTDDHPKPAKAFWPLIAEMARGSLYLPIPELMEFVLDYEINNNTAVFIADLEQKVADAWYEAAKSDQLNGKHKRAITRFDNAIRISGGHSPSEQAKAVSQAANNGEDQSP